ncbi:tetratricopeptide repeat protein [Desulfosarcina cetonica]|uniref:tetratricopeptide repeat protein n=1 Tax=Desulfosarcina cetonica TaxID=90730 RepID=UPI0006D04FE1|nr:tetratricopeptide repeat protein [Desulfosarcina cetonica]
MAEDALKAAIARAPQWNVPHENLAKLYLSQGKTQQAIANLENAIQKNNKNSGAVMTLALLYQKDGQLDKARAVYEKTLETDPRSWAAANNLAFLLADTTGTDADLDRALELARQAEKIKPDEATIKDTLGWIHHKRGDDEIAVTVLEEALEKFPDSGVINYHLAQVLADNDRLDEAREKLEQALAADENYPERSRAEALLKSIQGT